MKILIISSNLIGDTLLSTGVIKNLSIKYPNARFTIVIGPTAKSIFKNFKLVEKIITIKKKKYNMHWINILFKCFGKKWDIVVDFRSSLLSYFLPHTTKYIFKKNNISNQIQQLSDFFRFDCSHLFIETSKNEDEIVENNISKNFNYFVIFPGGNWKPKIWSPANYNKLIKTIILNNDNIKFILVGSNKEESIYFNEVTKDIDQSKIINLFGYSITQTAAYMKRSTMLIGNDSGLTHLASASKLKSIVLFGPTNDLVYGPFNKLSKVIRTKDSFNYFKTINIDKTKSYMDSISVEEVYDVLKLGAHCE
ncbi:MAG: glycosyltransferase family 9 protein [Alphaproteobacteria bacterium]